MTTRYRCPTRDVGRCRQEVTVVRFGHCSKIAVVLKSTFVDALGKRVLAASFDVVLVNAARCPVPIVPRQMLR